MLVALMEEHVIPGRRLRSSPSRRCPISLCMLELPVLGTLTGMLFCCGGRGMPGHWGGAGGKYPQK